MEKEVITVEQYDVDIPVYRCHTLVIGSGAAALNCACHLVNFGVKDVLIVTEELGVELPVNRAQTNKHIINYPCSERKRIQFMKWPGLCSKAELCTGI